MFTGIVEEIGKVISATSGSLQVAASKVLQGTEIGGSMAVNGVCLTVTNLDTASFAVNIMPETVSRTNLGQLVNGDKVNLERPLTLGKPLGGHLVQGHIDSTGTIIRIRKGTGSVLLEIEAPPELMRYIVAKGFVAIDGISLTIVSRDSNTFMVSIVDYTLRYTILNHKQAGHTVNLEADIIGKYVEQFTNAQQPGITTSFLQEHGFL